MSEADGPWQQGWVRCRICDHRHVAVIEVPAGQEAYDMECSQCGYLACDWDPEDGPCECRACERERASVNNEQRQAW